MENYKPKVGDKITLTEDIWEQMSSKDAIRLNKKPYHIVSQVWGESMSPTGKMKDIICIEDWNGIVGFNYTEYKGRK